MKKIIKKSMLAIMIVFFGLFIVVAFGVLIEKGVIKTSENKTDVAIERTKKSIYGSLDESELNDSSYYDTYEKALENSNSQTEENQYQNHIDEIIKKIENNMYITLYFRSVKNHDIECFTMAKFKKKKFAGKDKYAYLCSIPTEAKRNVPMVGTLKSLIEGQLSLSDYIQNIGVDPENARFVFGDCKSEKIYVLKIDGQEPSEIYKCFIENKQDMWEQLSFLLNSNGNLDVNYIYGKISDSNYSQVEREIIWAYEAFGFIPEKGSYTRKLLDNYLN
ncbi:MAG: DUF600 family protein [Hespellia sp.]|nr:DUF600 family protein [Hespellia sp.]